MHHIVIDQISLEILLDEIRSILVVGDTFCRLRQHSGVRGRDARRRDLAHEQYFRALLAMLRSRRFRSA